MLPVVLAISILLGIVPLVGIAWIIVAGSIMSVDGMFMSLILLTLSGIFFFNVFLELRDRGLLPVRKKEQAAPPKQPPASGAE